MNGPGDFTSIRVWHIHRTRCTRCGEVKEFQSEGSARQYAADHERAHNNPAIYRTPENVEFPPPDPRARKYDTYTDARGLPRHPDRDCTCPPFWETPGNLDGQP